MLKFSIPFLFLYFLLQNTQRCSSLPNPNAFQAAAVQRQLNTKNGVAAKGPDDPRLVFAVVKNQMNELINTIMDMYVGIINRKKNVKNEGPKGSAFSITRVFPGAFGNGGMT